MLWKEDFDLEAVCVCFKRKVERSEELTALFQVQNIMFAVDELQTRGITFWMKTA